MRRRAQRYGFSVRGWLKRAVSCLCFASAPSYMLASDGFNDGLSSRNRIAGKVLWQLLRRAPTTGYAVKRTALPVGSRFDDAALGCRAQIDRTDGVRVPLGLDQALPNVLANKSAKIAHTPMVVKPSEGAACIPAKTQAITTPAANIAPTLIESVLLTNSPQCLHFLASASISSAQNEHFRGLTLLMAATVTLDDMCFFSFTTGRHFDNVEVRFFESK